MRDEDCVALLQWALPRMDLSWPGFRRVRRQVCKRIARRLKALALTDLAAYRSYLETDPGEWPVLDSLCHITISRFYRDRGVFDHMRAQVLPELAGLARARGEAALACWCAGCASGEEAYTLSILWRLHLTPRFADLPLRLVATDANPTVLERARRGCYARGSLKDVPADWLTQAFGVRDALYCVRPDFRHGLSFERQDIRERLPDGPFHLVLCRNLVLTYFAAALQREVLGRLTERLVPGGVLVIGTHESVPPDAAGLFARDGPPGIYQKAGAA